MPIGQVPFGTSQLVLKTPSKEGYDFQTKEFGTGFASAFDMESLSTWVLSGARSTTSRDRHLHLAFALDLCNDSIGFSSIFKFLHMSLLTFSPPVHIVWKGNDPRNLEKTETLGGEHCEDSGNISGCHDGFGPRLFFDIGKGACPALPRAGLLLCDSHAHSLSDASNFAQLRTFLGARSAGFSKFVCVCRMAWVVSAIPGVALRTPHLENAGVVPRRLSRGNKKRAVS